MAWNRKKIIDFCIEQIFPNVKTWTGFKGEMMEIVKMVSDFRRKNNFPENMTAKVNDGFLYINNISVGRIAPKMPRAYAYSARADYWEGRVLAQQEAIWHD